MHIYSLISKSRYILWGGSKLTTFDIKCAMIRPRYSNIIVTFITLWLLVFLINIIPKEVQDSQEHLDKHFLKLRKVRIKVRSLVIWWLKWIPPPLMTQTEPTTAYKNSVIPNNSKGKLSSMPHSSTLIKIIGCQ